MRDRTCRFPFPRAAGRSLYAVLLCVVSGTTPLPAQDTPSSEEAQPLARTSHWFRVVGPEAPGPAETPEEPPQTLPPATDDLERLVRELFEAYEREDAPGFIQLVHPTFSARDRSGNDYRFADLPRALADDFENLDRIRFTVFAGQVTVQSDGRRAEIEVRWSRRAWVQVGGEEWILLDQKSVFQFDRSGERGPWQLSRIFDDPIFGLADRRGQILASAGTIDGEPIETPVLLDRFQGIVRPPIETGGFAQLVPPGGGPGPGGGGTILSGTFTIREGRMEFDSQTFLNGFAPPLAGNDLFWSPVNGGCCGNILADNGTVFEIVPPPGGGLDGLLAVPDPGAFPYCGPFAACMALAENGTDVGRVFAVRTDLGFFAAFEIIGFTDLGAGQEEYTIRFRYQTNGTRNMQ